MIGIALLKSNVSNLLIYYICLKSDILSDF